MIYRFCFALVCFALLTSKTFAQSEPGLKVAVLDFGLSAFAQTASDRLAENFKATGVTVLDRDLSRAAAKGIGYDGSLNLTRQQARDLGSTLGTSFYILGDAQTLRRSPSSGKTYFESYVSIFVVSARTGKLLTWERLAFEAAEAKLAEVQLFAALATNELRERFNTVMKRTSEEELKEVVRSFEPPPVIEDAPDEKAAEQQGLQLPRPFRRLRPAYPDSAARAEAEATVDVVADIDDKGDVTKVEVERWAGFGLDAATIDTVRQIRFFPALKNGVPIPIRVMLRYNFRKPPVN